MRQWRHSGFSVHNQVRVKAGDARGRRRRLARYMIRNPFALAKMTYDPSTAMIIYRSKLHATLKRNYQLMPALKWLRACSSASSASFSRIHPHARRARYGCYRVPNYLPKV